MPEPPLAPAPVARPRRRPLGFELALAAVVALGVLLPGISRYSLVDPWETHYGEVARRMLQDHDWVHTDWQDEGFRSKPVLTFWMMASSMRLVGLAHDGGYSGEMEHDARTMLAIRLPFVLFGVLGLLMMWWMLARLVNRRLAWLALLVVGSCPFFCLVARQGIPDMPLTATVIGAFATFVMALEDGDRPIDTVLTIRLPGRRRLALDQRHLLLLVVGGFVLLQAVYYAVYFTSSPRLAVRGVPNPAVFLPALMLVMLGALARDGWRIVRLPFLLVGGAMGWLLDDASARPAWRSIWRPGRRGSRGRSIWRALCDDVLARWERHALDRYLVRAFPLYPIAWVCGLSWADTQGMADRVFGMAPITTTRQVYLLWCYALLGVGILAKGPPGLAVIGLVGVAYLVLFGGWRALYEGRFELKRGLLLMIVVFLPWHIGMWLKDGPRFIDEYLFTHILNRAAVGVDNSPGTFEYYTSQIGHGMWLWAALLPAAIAAAVVGSRTDTREGRVRFLVAVWAIGGFAFFGIVQTKFHHYILPVVPALGLLVAFFLEDVLAHRARLHWLYALLGIGIVLLVCRDLMWEPERWIEMFTFRYDRPWPSGAPWRIDPSDGFLALGVLAALALAIAALPWRRIGVAALGIAGLAICLWSLHVYMPIAGTHWGMRAAIHDYYEDRTIYGEKLIYFGPRELYEDWHGVGDRWTFETFVPRALQLGQPMTITVELNAAKDERALQQRVALLGHVTRIGDHDVEVTLAPGQRARLAPLEARGQADPTRGRPPVRVVDADRLIAWQLYWRGENFWSGNEIFAWPLEMHTAFVKTDNVAFKKYLNDRTMAPLGRRYFLITEAGRAQSVRSLLPTQRARDSFEIVSTDSNKFTMVSFDL